MTDSYVFVSPDAIVAVAFVADELLVSGFGSK